MSTINVVFDTKSKEVKIDVDGKKVSNVVRVIIDTYTDNENSTKGFIELHTVVCNEDENMTQVTKTYAVQRADIPVDTIELKPVEGSHVNVDALVQAITEKI